MFIENEGHGDGTLSCSLVSEGTVLASGQSGDNEESTRGSPGPGFSEHWARKLGSTGDDKCNCLCKHVASPDTEKKRMAIRREHSVQSLRTCMQSITV